MLNNQQTPLPAKVHDLKIAPADFAEQMAGTKTFELRADDRGFEVGHVLCLREYAVNGYTSRTLRREIVGLLRGPAFGLQQGWVILSTAPVPSNELGHFIACFDAAFDEGLDAALAETTDERLKDLVERRLLAGYYQAIGPSVQKDPS